MYNNIFNIYKKSQNAKYRSDCFQIVYSFSTNMVLNNKIKKSYLSLFQIIQILKKKYCKLKFILLPGIYYEESPSSLYDFIVTNQFIFRLKYFYTMCPSLCVLLNQAYWHLSSVTRVSKMVLKHFVTKSKWVSKVNFHKNEKILG